MANGARSRVRGGRPRRYGDGVTDTAPATPLPGLDLPAVLTWLDGVRPGTLSATGTTAKLIAGGRSNLTYLLDDGERQVVVRRPPLGHVLATAHDMGREHRMISALAGTPVPVPEPIAMCQDEAVNGAPFYVMSYVDGLIVRQPQDAEGLGQGIRWQLSEAMMDVLAKLHDVDPEAAGLAGYGRPEGFMERQVRRWGKQLDGSRSRELPGIEELREGLAANVPVSPPPAVVHGDYRLDNLIVAPPGAPDELQVRAVLDWEMATIGDPLADVGLLLGYWDVLSRLRAESLPTIGPASGFPDGATLVEWYAKRRDVDLSALPWYTAFGIFKIAVILEGIHYRFQAGQTVGAGFDRIGEQVPPLVQAGLDTLPR